jgi:hypothetical protein
VLQIFSYKLLQERLKHDLVVSDYVRLYTQRKSQSLAEVHICASFQRRISRRSTNIHRSVETQTLALSCIEDKIKMFRRNLGFADVS